MPAFLLVWLVKELGLPKWLAFLAFYAAVAVIVFGTLEITKHNYDENRRMEGETRLLARQTAAAEKDDQDQDSRLAALLPSYLRGVKTNATLYPLIDAGFDGLCLTQGQTAAPTKSAGVSGESEVEEIPGAADREFAQAARESLKLCLAYKTEHNYDAAKVEAVSAQSP